MTINDVILTIKTNVGIKAYVDFDTKNYALLVKYNKAPVIIKEDKDLGKVFELVEELLISKSGIALSENSFINVIDGYGLNIWFEEYKWASVFITKEVGRNKLFNRLLRSFYKGYVVDNKDFRLLYSAYQSSIAKGNKKIYIKVRKEL